MNEMYNKSNNKNLCIVTACGYYFGLCYVTKEKKRKKAEMLHKQEPLSNFILYRNKGGKENNKKHIKYFFSIKDVRQESDFQQISYTQIPNIL